MYVNRLMQTLQEGIQKLLGSLSLLEMEHHIPQSNSCNYVLAGRSQTLLTIADPQFIVTSLPSKNPRIIKDFCPTQGFCSRFSRDLVSICFVHWVLIPYQSCLRHLKGRLLPQKVMILLLIPMLLQIGMKPCPKEVPQKSASSFSRRITCLASLR